jgi:hypothetical protein
MPWTPLFEESTELEIISKMMTVIHRDVKEALDYKFLDSPTYLTRYGVTNSVGATGEDLPAFAVMTEGEVDQFAYPILTLAVEQGGSEETVSGEWLDQQVNIGMGIAVQAATVKAGRQRAKKYRWALKAVLRDAVLELLPAINQHLDYSTTFRWRYFKHETEGINIVQEAEMIMQIKFGEK